MIEIEETKNMTDREKDKYYEDWHTWKIVETDNFNGDYPDEKFVNLPSTDKETAKKICDIINGYSGAESSRYYMVVNMEYKLVPGFEP